MGVMCVPGEEDGETVNNESIELLPASNIIKWCIKSLDLIVLLLSMRFDT